MVYIFRLKKNSKRLESIKAAHSTKKNIEYNKRRRLLRGNCRISRIKRICDYIRHF